MYIVVHVVAFSLHYLLAMGCTVHSGLIDSNSVDCGLAIHQPSIPYGADCRAFVLYYMCCCVPYSSTFIEKGWFVAYDAHDPIDADLVSYTKIHGQDKLISTH